jgi:hypothetical protein
MDVYKTGEEILRTLDFYLSALRNFVPVDQHSL